MKPSPLLNAFALLAIVALTACPSESGTPESAGPGGSCRTSIEDLRQSSGGNLCPAVFPAGTKSIDCSYHRPRSLALSSCQGLQVLEIDWNDKTTCFYDAQGRLVGLSHWAHTQQFCSGTAGTISAGQSVYCGFGAATTPVSCQGGDGGVD